MFQGTVLDRILDSGGPFSSIQLRGVEMLHKQMRGKNLFISLHKNLDLQKETPTNNFLLRSASPNVQHLSVNGYEFKREYKLERSFEIHPWFKFRCEMCKHIASAPVNSTELLSCKNQVLVLFRSTYMYNAGFVQVDIHVVTICNNFFFRKLADNISQQMLVFFWGGACSKCLPTFYMQTVWTIKAKKKPANPQCL